MIQIQATIMGYGGRPCSLFSAFDEDTGILVVSAEAEYRRERRAGCIVIANSPDVARDMSFGNEDVAEAIAAFYRAKLGVAMDGRSSALVFAERAARANPDASIENDGMGERGPRYRVADSVTCAHIAALATCLYARQANGIERAVSLCEDFARLARGEVITI